MKFYISNKISNLENLLGRIISILERNCKTLNSESLIIKKFQNCKFNLIEHQLSKSEKCSGNISTLIIIWLFSSSPFQ